MKDLDFVTLLSVFNEMMGPVLWLLVILAIAGVSAFLFVLMRERELKGTRLIRAELIGVAGGFAAPCHHGLDHRIWFHRCRRPSGLAADRHHLGNRTGGHYDPRLCGHGLDCHTRGQNSLQMKSTAHVYIQMCAVFCFIIIPAMHVKYWSYWAKPDISCAPAATVAAPI